MNNYKTALIATALCVAAVAGARTVVGWSTLGNDTGADGASSYTQRFEIVSDVPVSRIAFNQFARRMSMANSADTLIEIVPGYYAVGSPRLREAAPGDTVRIDIVTRGSLMSICYEPDGIHAVDADGKPFPVDVERMDITKSPRYYATAKTDRMPYGDVIFGNNSRRAPAVAVGAYDLVPSFKKVDIKGVDLHRLTDNVSVVDTSDPRPEYMKMEISRGDIRIQTNDPERAMLRISPLLEAGELPDAVVEDWPDFPYRGLMIDIARNFQPVDQLKRVVDLMARYGLNTLHFHFADDEAWRLEIPGLPELTDVGGRRGYSAGHNDFLPQIFCGEGNPDNPAGTSNGYYSVEEMVDFLRYAAGKGVKVLPEVESPGHARAAILAMEKRMADTGDGSMRLIDPADTSKYTSAQAFHDNVMNPALPGPVRFMSHVARELKNMYTRAGVEMPGLHIGGDEVARGAWTGSPVAQQWLSDNGLDNERLLHLKYVRELLDSLIAMEIPVSGWQEIAVGHDDEYNEAVRPHVFSVNCWSTLGKQKSVTVQSAEGGYPTVLSNVDHFYLDMCYNYHPMERGLTWGGTVDEFDALHGYPHQLCPVGPEAFRNVVGVSGQVFAETLRSPGMLEYFLLPKMLGLAERAWNADSTYTDTHFNSVVAQREIPWWGKHKYNFHVGQPGIVVDENGIVEMNAPYTDLPVEIRYTTDGSEPGPESALYTGPFSLSSGARLRAKAFVGEHSSLTTHTK